MLSNDENDDKIAEGNRDLGTGNTNSEGMDVGDANQRDF